MPALLHTHVHARRTRATVSSREVLDRRELRDVGDAAGDVEAVAAQPRDRLVERTGLDVGEHHLHPALGEVAAHRQADAVGAAGDDRDLPLDRLARCLPARLTPTERPAAVEDSRS